MRAHDEDEDEDIVEGPPERPLSPHPNFVTPDGLAHIELELARQQVIWTEAEAGGDAGALAEAGCDLRYWVARRATAQVVAAPRPTGRVQFGSSVQVRPAGGRRQTWRIVGEDEAGTGDGMISYVSPLAQALVGRAKGEVVEAEGSTFEILSIG